MDDSIFQNHYRVPDLSADRNGASDLLGQKKTSGKNKDERDTQSTKGEPYFLPGELSWVETEDAMKAITQKWCIWNWNLWRCTGPLYRVKVDKISRRKLA